MRAAIEAHLGSEQVSRVIYGAVIGLALVVALENHPPAAGVVVGSICGTALAVALAELYSDVVGTETRTRRRVGRAGLVSIAAQAGAVAFGIALPAVFFVLAAVGVMELATAFTIAKWTGLGLIALYGYLGAFADKVGSIAAPTLVVGGSGDPMFSPDALRAGVVAPLPRARLALVDAGHEVPIERPRELAALIEAFLAALD